MISDLWQDLRFALRSLKLRPGYSLLVIVTLALGIGANVAIFDLTNAAVLRPLDVPAPEELIVFAPTGMRGRKTSGDTRVPGVDGRVRVYPYLLFQQLEKQLEGVTLAARNPSFNPSVVWRESGASADGTVANGRCASAGFFDVLGLPPHLGRTFEAEDDRVQGARPVVVLSHRFWQLRFDGDAEAIGQRVMVNGNSFQVIGVAAPGFNGATPGNRIDFWVPMGMANTLPNYGPDLYDPSFSWLELIGRLKPGVSPESVQAKANRVLEQYIASDPQRAKDAAQSEKLRIEVESGDVGFSRTSRNLKEPLYALLGGVGVLLLIVYLNVSHLMLARSASRRHEMTIRSSVGATRGRIVRQLLTEGLVLSGLGAAAGALAAGWLSRGLASLAQGGSVGRFNYELELGMDERVVAFTVALTLGTTLVIGLVPAIYALSTTSQNSMRSAGRTVAGGRRGVSRFLMAAQVGCSVVLLISAGLLANSLARLGEVPTGLDEEHVLLVGLELHKAGLSEERQEYLRQEIPRRLKAQPGIQAASFSIPQVFAGARGTEVTFVGTKREPEGLTFYRVTPDYFATLGIEVLRGRNFSESDSPESPRVALINETMATQEFKGEAAIGQRIRIDGENDIEVIGVVSDTRTFTLWRPPLPTFYLPFSQPHGLNETLEARSLEVRGHGDPAQLVELARNTVAEVHPGLAFMSSRTLSKQVSSGLVLERLMAILASAFALSALLLVAVGLYGVISQWVAQRSREIGVRIALGATPGTVQRLVLRQALVPVLIGLVLGTLATVPLSEFLKQILYDLEPMDVPTLVGVGLLLLLVASAAGYVPARRAARVEPVVAMRCE